MRKYLAIVFVFSLCAINTVSAQLLYKISGNGLEKPSYILGTYHMKDIDALQNIKGSEKVVWLVDQFCGELDRKNFIKVMRLNNSAKPDSLPNGQTIKDLFSAKQFEQINERLKSELNIDFITYPQLLSQMGRLYPASFASMLTMDLLMDVNNINSTTFVPMDVALVITGEQFGKPVIGLETAELQFKILTRLPPLKEQKKQLLDLIDNWEGVKMLAEYMGKAYEQQNVAFYTELLKNKHSRRVLVGTKTTYELLFTERNIKWAEKMPLIMEQKPTLFFVGALHLIGKDSVLALLKKQGYTIEPVM